MHDLENISRQIRETVITMSHRAKASHLGSSLSCIDLLTALYWEVLRIDPKHSKAINRDRFILSKGHAAAALYATLAHRGFCDLKCLEDYAQNGTSLAEHPAPQCLPGVEAATGSLGHGLSIGLGMALAGRIKKQNFNTYVLMSDGECNEGSVWEAAMFAPNKHLEHLTVIIDFNKWQATGRSQEVMSLDPLIDKWRSFGWKASEIDGHSFEEIVEALKEDSQGKSKAIIAHTIKGKGVSFMEDDNNWHYRIPNDEELELARKELELLHL